METNSSDKGTILNPLDDTHDVVSSEDSRMIPFTLVDPLQLDVDLLRPVKSREWIREHVWPSLKKESSYLEMSRQSRSTH